MNEQDPTSSQQAYENNTNAKDGDNETNIDSNKITDESDDNESTTESLIAESSRVYYPFQLYGCYFIRVKMTWLTLFYFSE
jgi:hypothetical protein